MKIAGKKLVSVPVSPVILPRPDGDVVLQVAPFSPGLEERMKLVGLFNYPEPPQKAVMNGSLVWKLPGGGLQLREDYSDPTFRRKMALVNVRMNAIRIADALRKDSSVEFSRVAPKGSVLKEWEEYADALAAEISDPETGFLDSEVEAVLRTAMGAKVTIETDSLKDEFLGESPESLEDPAS